MQANKPVSFSQLKTFQGVIDNNICLLEYYKKYVLRLRSEGGEAAQKGLHYEYLITGQEPNRGSEFEQLRVKEGKLKKDGSYYSDWDQIPEKADLFANFCREKKIGWTGGKTHLFIENGIRHKIITDIEATYKGKDVIIDLKFTSSLTLNIKKEWSWKVDNWVDVEQMLNNGYKIWQALYYCAVLLQTTGKKYDFVFFVQSSAKDNFTYFPYYLTFTIEKLMNFWEQMETLIEKEKETMSLFDELDFVGEADKCVNCDMQNNCSNKNLVSNFIYI